MLYSLKRFILNLRSLLMLSMYYFTLKKVSYVPNVGVPLTLSFSGEKSKELHIQTIQCNRLVNKSATHTVSQKDDSKIKIKIRNILKN